MEELTVPAYLRGEIIDGDLIGYGGRGNGGGGTSLRCPAPAGLLDRLPLGDPLLMRDLHALTTEDVVDCLAALGPRLSLDRNELLREALESSAGWSDMTPPVLRACYERLPSYFTPDAVRAIAEHTIGTRHLDGWVTVPPEDACAAYGRTAAVRALGARTVHIIAGNSPEIAALTIIRNAVVRGDALIKAPSNDPLTALALARTLAETAPGHPLTRHLAVAYWKGGDEEFERRLYRPEHFEKILAWGGLASVRHITRYVQPGLELICLDPKLSATVIGPEAFATPETMRYTARLAAVDVGALNQLGCFNARVVHVVTGTDDKGLALATRWGELLYEQIQRLPASVSTPARRFDASLRADLVGLRTSPDWYRVVGGRDDEGAVIVSLTPDPVDFHPALTGRVANVVPVADAADAVRTMNAYTQTVGVFPDSLKERLRDLVPLYGAQRLVSLGHATRFRPDLPQDAMEPLRRMAKWVVDETYDPDVTRLTENFDHHDPAFTPDLACPVHRAIRERGAVVRTEAHGGAWILSRHRDVLAALRDHDTFSSASGVFFPRAPGTPAFAPLEYDPPEHTAYRSLMKVPFQLSEARRLEPRIREAVTALVTPLAERGGGDLVRELAVPLPLTAVGMAVGFTDEAVGRIRELSRNTWEHLPKDASADGFWPQFTELLDGEIRRAREEPGDDYLSRLVRSRIDGRPVTDRDLHVMLVAFAIAGHETSMNALSHLLWQLAREPALQDRLRAEPGLIPAAVEEALRLWTPVDHGTRVTTRDTEIAGERVPAGSRVVLLTGAANRDPARFPDPDTFRLDRAGHAPVRHLTFGQGIHFCIGAHMARIEFAAVLRELAGHPDYEPAGEVTRSYEAGRHVCLDALPVRFRSARARPE
ncbi:hypothetical protein GCM10010129_01170 [Streptomyces fumigatiscleroticus]|nr:hypothetical protein GCM10010129_01170 [Streptomyces fumigatiscleroticus]